MSLQQDQQDIADATTALQSLGLTQPNFTPALQQLLKLRNAQQDIQKIQQNQFYPNAFDLISQVQNASAQTDKVVLIAQYLRQFAEYIATQTQALQGTHATIVDIVNNIPPMGGNS